MKDIVIAGAGIMGCAAAYYLGLRGLKAVVLDKSRIAVTGGSYGGYMTLASMTHFNDRLRCGVDVVGRRAAGWRWWWLLVVVAPDASGRGRGRA